MSTYQRRRFLATMAAGTAGAVLTARGAGARVHTPKSNFVRDFLPTWNRSRDCTLEFAEAMPPETYDFRPNQEVRTYKEQMLHIAESNVLFVSFLMPDMQLERDFSPGGKMKPDTIDLVRDSFDFAGEAIGHLTDEQLAGSVEVFVGPVTRETAILMMRDHVTHHRGQAVIYLRMNGIVPPAWVGH